jgi:serine phosphatase RsbU (regulator of sigma subunit)
VGAPRLQSPAVPTSPALVPHLLQPPRFRLLLVEDDAGDALLVQELLLGAGEGPEFDVEWVRSIAEAQGRCTGADVACALVDLGLPDATGLDALQRMLEACPEAAVVVLTGQRDRSLALQAVAAGAQDYLIKDEVNPALLDRTVRLAIERRIAERAAVALAEAALREQHNGQVVRGLLPHLRVRDPRLTMVTRYQPGNAGEVLGGDFLDAVELDDGTVRAVIGDVAGHGPGEAAVGVNLRIAWRALTVAGSPPEVAFRVLNDQIINDADTEEVFATVAAVSIDPDRRELSVRVAGHPSPILWAGDEVRELDVRRTTVVGFDADDIAPETIVELPPVWRLMLYTDGLIEGRDGATTGRWGAEGLVAFLRTLARASGDGIADALLAEAVRRHGGPLPDDVAILLICNGG